MKKSTVLAVLCLLAGPAVSSAQDAEKPDEVGPALKAAKETNGPSVVCLKTDLEANLAVPEDYMMRFFEVYQGPQ